MASPAATPAPGQQPTNGKSPTAKRPFTRSSDVAMEAELRGLGPPEQQFECMRQQLVMADVVNLDMGCKNIFYKDGSLTLGDFDAARVGGFPEAIFPRASTPRSDSRGFWTLLRTDVNQPRDPRFPWGLCFKRGEHPAVFKARFAG